MEGSSLECFICFDRYDLHTHLPRILPLCGHTICENCLKDILKSARPQCPLDQIVFASKDMNSFPQNYALKGMLQSISRPKGDCDDNNEEKTEKNQKIPELKTLVGQIDRWTLKASQDLETRHKLMKVEVEVQFEKLFKAMEEKKKIIAERLNGFFIQEKAKLKDDLETYELLKIDVLNIIKELEKNNNDQDLMIADTSMITNSLTEAKKSFESLYISRLTELTQGFSRDLSEITSQISKLDIKNHSKESQENIQRHAPPSDIAFQIISIPNYSDQKVISVADKLGPFVYNDQQEEDHNLPSLPPYQFVDGNFVYKGQWKNGERHGRGECYWTDSSRYVGYWRNDEAHGKGRLIHSDGDVYEGEWVNDKAHGKGIYTHFDGAHFEGDWYEDKQQGKGKETWPDGGVYEGDYLKGKKHGKGVFAWGDGSRYQGDFKDNIIDGHGLYEWSDGRAFIGTWKDNKMHGSGVFTWSDGRKYTGEYVDDKKQGYGEFEWPDGRKYKGFWKNGKQDGKGAYINSKGQSKEGEWADGKRVRWI